MKSEIFDGGGSFEQLFWSGENASGKAPRDTTDKRMEVEDGSEKKKKKEEKEEETAIILTEEDLPL